MNDVADIRILRDLAKQYADLAADPVQEERRDLWRAHMSLKTIRPPVLINYGSWNAWCKVVFGDHSLQCQDPFYREHERSLRIQLSHREVGDDWIHEPWITQAATHRTPSGWCRVWGVDGNLQRPDDVGGAFKVVQPALNTWDDMARMTAPKHDIDEQATTRNVERLQDAVGDIIEVDVNRGPVLQGFAADISTSLAYLRGLEQLMLDMYESPGRLHALLAFMRDGILANQQQAEDAGDFSLTCSSNQAMPYAEELEDQTANSGPRRRKNLWGFFAAQEYTLISPRFHDEFLYQYQLPIMANYGLTHYGCCEDLTRKIDMLRQAPNLRSIGVTPVADVARSAEQIQGDYVFSWRPNPTDMVCGQFSEDRIRRIIREGLWATRGCHVHIYLKDVETVEGEPSRLARWVRIVRDEIDRLY